MAERKSIFVDRGGVRKPDGKIGNTDTIRGKIKRNVTLENIPPACDSTTIEPALENLEKLLNNPDKTDKK